MVDLLIVLLILGIVGGAVISIRRALRKGQRCIGCPGGCCSGCHQDE